MKKIILKIKFYILLPLLLLLFLITGSIYTMETIFADRKKKDALKKVLIKSRKDLYLLQSKLRESKNFGMARRFAEINGLKWEKKEEFISECKDLVRELRKKEKFIMDLATKYKLD